MLDWIMSPSVYTIVLYIAQYPGEMLV